MSDRFDLVLRQVKLADGRVVDVGVGGGRFADIAPRLPISDNDIDGTGKLLLPGLHDHHIHLLATAARMQSVDLAGLIDPDSIISALRSRAAEIAPGEWVRAVGYDERAAGIPDRHLLDMWLPQLPMLLGTLILVVAMAERLVLICQGKRFEAVEVGTAMSE